MSAMRTSQHDEEPPTPAGFDVGDRVRVRDDATGDGKAFRGKVGVVEKIVRGPLPTYEAAAQATSQEGCYDVLLDGSEKADLLEGYLLAKING